MTLFSKTLSLVALVLGFALSGLSLQAHAEEPVFNISKTYRILTIRAIAAPGTGAASQTYKDAVKANTDKTCSEAVGLCESAIGKQCVRVAGGITGTESNAVMTTYQIECQARQIK
jgi:hypothetical protein